MPRAPIDCEIEAGLRVMPTHEAAATALRLVASLAAGIAILGMDREVAHPVNRSFDDMRTRFVRHCNGDTLSVDELVSLIEQVCFQIWTLSVFQGEPLKSKLQELVQPICSPPAKIDRKG